MGLGIIECGYYIASECIDKISKFIPFTIKRNKTIVISNVKLSVWSL